ncbi:MAG TPA: hypothetical protein VLF20_00170 [Patescibacteria group bacterium]|nr:hypothetical protein [Patescibacteria group bacterium]
MPDIFIHTPTTDSAHRDARRDTPQRAQVQRSDAHPLPHSIQKPETDKRETAPTITTIAPKKQTLNLFSTFVRDPKELILAEQHADERILLFIRRDFITNISWIIFSIFLLLVPPFLPLFFEPLRVPLQYFDLPAQIIFTIFYYVAVAGYILMNFVTWFYDIGIFTQKRAVDIDFFNISFVSVATARLQDLKDVRYEQKGFYESLFDYGNITLSVVASGETLVYEHTPHPAEVASLLSVLTGGYQQ